MKKIIWIIAELLSWFDDVQTFKQQKTTENRVYQYDKEKPISVSVDTIRLQNIVDAGNYTGTLSRIRKQK